MEKEHDKYRSYLKERRDRKWKKFIERYKTNSLIFGINENESTRPFQAISNKEKNYEQDKGNTRIFRIKKYS